jgi:DNA repair exonuclease SbcCD ATPase subunit
MQDAADGLESGAVHLANDEGDAAVQELNAVVIELLQTAQAMSSCASGMPMSSFMQQLKELSGDQQKLNDAIKRMREQGGMSLDKRLQGQMRNLAQEQQRIQQELEKLVQEMGSGQGLLGRLDDVSQKLDEVAKKLSEGKMDEATLREQEWALTRLLDSQRSMRERDLGRERISETGEDLADGVPPSALPEGMERTERDLREDLLKALERRYPPKYEDLIRRYFRELSREAPVPDLP